MTRFDATDRRPVDKWTAAPRPTTSPQGQKPQQKRSTHMVHKPVNSECSRHEILTLRWDDVDRKARELRLRDAKTGARMVPLTPTAAAVLAGIARAPRSPWVFAGVTPDRHLSQLSTYWRHARGRCGLEDVSIHDLRHSFASRALALGESLNMIGRLLGHTDIASTARYAHLVRDAEKVAAAKVGDSIKADILRTENAAQRAEA